MSVFKLLSAAFVCALLTACITVTETSRPHDARLRSAASPAANKRDPAFSAPSPAAPVANALRSVNLDFRVINAHAKIGRRDYVLDPRNRPVITALGNNVYQLELPLRRSNKSSLRGDETLRTHFYYDGLELIFFGDKNRNQRFDRRESGVRHLISHTQELITQKDKRYIQPRTLDVTLTRKHISSSQRINTLKMQLIFQVKR